MNVKRLTILRDALIAYAKDQGNLQFNLGTWTDIPAEYHDHDPNRVLKRARAGANYCGTAACACGLATTIPSFRRAGLRLDRYGDIYNELTGRESLYAVQKFFDITNEDAAELFLGSRYEPEARDNPLAVADKITALLHTA